MFGASNGRLRPLGKGGGDVEYDLAAKTADILCLSPDPDLISIASLRSKPGQINESNSA